MFFIIDYLFINKKKIHLRFEEKFKNNHMVMSERNKYLHKMELELLSSDPAETWRDVSVSENGSYKVYKGDQTINWKDRGYSTILDILMVKYFFFFFLTFLKYMHSCRRR